MTNAVSDHADSLIGKRYRLLERIGEGGMGTVFRAEDRLTGHIVALKRVILSDLTEGSFSDASDASEIMLRLALSREFETAARLRHPHIINVLDYGYDAQRQPYIVMDLLENAKELVHAAEALSQAARMQLIVAILQALVYLHRRKLLHRDLKPSNVLVDGHGNLKILDFGLAISVGADTPLAGTLAYLAPELLNGEPPSIASDLYAVGVITYEVFAGKAPFDSISLETLMLDILTKMPEWSPLPDLTPAVLLETAHQQASGYPASPTDPPDTRPPVAPTTMDTSQATSPDPIAGVAPKTEAQRSEPQAVGHARHTPTGTPQQEPAAPPESLREIIAKLLSKLPQDRYPNAASVLTALYSTKDKAAVTEAPTLRESFLQAAQFVGREAELNTLLGAINQAQAGKGSAWLIAGESGVGKSRFLNEVRIHALVSGMLVLRGQAVEEGGYPYQLWRDAVRWLVLSAPLSALEASILKEVVPDLAALLGREVGDPPELPSKAAQERLSLTIVDLFLRQDQPVLLLVEDLHWAQDSLFILKTLLNVVTRLPLLVVGSYRDDDMPTLPSQLPGAEVLNLARLDDLAVATLCAAMLGEAGRNPDLLHLIRTETEGNTFFIVELMRALAEEAGSLSEIGMGTLPKGVITDNVQQFLNRRLDRVPDWGHGLLRLAAVAGQLLDLNVLRHLAAKLNTSVMVDALENWLTVCANAAVLDIADNQWRFAHDKLRHATLQNLSEDERAHHHRQVAEAIETVYPDDMMQADTLMQHWKAAGDIAKELDYLLLVAERTMRTTADYQRVVELGERGLALLTTHDQRRLRLLNVLGEAKLRLGQYQEAREHLLQVAAIRDETPFHQKLAAQALQTLGWVDSYTANYESADASFWRSIEMANAMGATTVVASGYHGLGHNTLNIGDFAAAQGYFSKALEIAQATEQWRVVASALSGLGIVELRLGNHAAGRDYFTRSLDFVRQTGDRWGVSGALNNAGAIAINIGEFETAKLYLLEALEISRLLGDGRWIATGVSNLGAIAQAQGDLEAALTYFKEGLSYRQAIGDKLGVVNSLRNIGVIVMEQGNPSEASNYLREGVDLARSIDDKNGLTWSLFSLAQADIQQSELTLGRRHLHDGLAAAVEIKAGQAVAQCLLTAGQLALASGMPEQGARYCGVAQAHESFSPNDQKDLDTVRRQFEAVMSSTAFDALLAEGRLLPQEAVITQLLASLDEASL